MKHSEYQRKIAVTMVPRLWIGAAFWPFILYVGMTRFSTDG